MDEHRNEQRNKHFNVIPSVYFQVFLLLFSTYIITFQTISKQEHVSNNYISQRLQNTFTSEVF
jgi:hypothetical protein